MLSEVGRQVAKMFGGRFSLTNLLPVVLLTALVWLLIISGAYTDHPADLATVVRQLGRDPLQAGLAVFGVILAGVLLRPFQVALVQFLEGYWRSRALGLLKTVATEQHLRRRSNAEIVANAALPESASTSFAEVVRYTHRQWRVERKADRAAAVLGRYPAEDQVMPTSIGNVLRAGEKSAGGRYGLELNAITERLWPSLSPTIAGSISRNLDLIDTMCALCVALFSATAIALPAVWHLSGWSWIPLVTSVVAAVAYRAALRAATGHAALLAAAVDLHRFDMLTALHFRLPRSAAEEHRFNTALSDFFAKDQPAFNTRLGNVRYQHPAPSGPAKPDASA